MKTLFEVLPPTMPNFVQFKKKPQLKQDGFKVERVFHIKDFTKEEAEEYAELMRVTFIEHWEKSQNKAL